MSEPHSIDLLSDEAFGWYFTGLSDGESSFFFRSQPERWRNSRFVTYVASFRITMRDDESEHIEAVARRMKCGNTYRFANKRAKTKANPSISWYVSKTSDLAEVIVPHFDRFALQFKKSRDFVVWKPCVLLLHKIKARTRRGNGRVQRTKMTDEEAAFFADAEIRLKASKQYEPKISLTPRNKISCEREYPLFKD